MNRLMLVTVCILCSNAAFAGWHHFDKVTRVTVRGDDFFVRGTNPTGHQCVDEANFYGTLTHKATEPGHKETYTLALSAYLTGKGLSCYVYQTRQNGVCVMENCYIRN